MFRFSELKNAYLKNHREVEDRKKSQQQPMESWNITKDIASRDSSLIPIPSTTDFHCSLLWKLFGIPD